MIPNIMEELDSLESPKVYEHNGSLYLVWMKARNKADIGSMDKRLHDMLMRQLTTKKQELTLKSYLEQAKDEKKGWHKVVKNESKMERGESSSSPHPLPATFNDKKTLYKRSDDLPPQDGRSSDFQHQLIEFINGYGRRCGE
jgi:murein L,D-transpeptidase YcbB/YkuD